LFSFIDHFEADQKKRKEQKDDKLPNRLRAFNTLTKTHFDIKNVLLTAVENNINYSALRAGIAQNERTGRLFYSNPKVPHLRFALYRKDEDLSGENCIARIVPKVEKVNNLHKAIYMMHRAAPKGSHMIFPTTKEYFKFIGVNQTSIKKVPGQKYHRAYNEKFRYFKVWRSDEDHLNDPPYRIKGVKISDDQVQFFEDYNDVVAFFDQENIFTKVEYNAFKFVAQKHGVGEKYKPKRHFHGWEFTNLL
jgi:hypothetical protein